MRTILLTAHLCYARWPCKTGFFFFFKRFNRKLFFYYYYYCLLFERTSALCERLLLREKYTGTNEVRKKTLRFDVDTKGRVRGQHTPMTINVLYVLTGLLPVLVDQKTRRVCTTSITIKGGVGGGEHVTRRRATKYRVRNIFFNLSTS